MTIYLADEDRLGLERHIGAVVEPGLAINISEQLRDRRVLPERR